MRNYDILEFVCMKLTYGRMMNFQEQPILTKYTNDVKSKLPAHIFKQSATVVQMHVSNAVQMQNYRLWVCLSLHCNIHNI